MVLRGDEVAGRSISYYRSLLLGAVGRGGGATSSSSPHQGPKLHATLLKTGILPTTTSISNALFHMYAACGPSSSALQAFQEIPRPHRSVIDWTALLSCHSRCGLPSETLHLFRTMELEDGLVGDEVTMVCVLGACARLRDAVAGAAAHLRIIKSGLPFTVAARNAAMDMYAKCGMMGHAWELFDEMMTPTIVSWTVILTGALRWEGLNSGRQVFDRMGEKNEISWTVMVSAYVEAGLPREALSLLAQMLSQQHHDIDQNGEVAGVVSLNHVTICSLLSACSQASDLTVARWVHAYSTRMTSTVLMGDNEDQHHHQKLMVGTALIDVYAKCGKIDTARLLFEKMPQRNVVAWNAMLSGLAMHGLGSDVLCLFSRMVSNGFDPDEITLVSVLSACSRSGLVDEGRKCFLELEAVYGVTPTVEHYACAVDLLGRAGHLGEAESLVRKMPMRPSEVVLGSLLASCCLHGELALGRQLMEDLVRVDPLNTEYHILLSNMYASAGNQAEAVSFREVLRKRGVRKVPGMSYISIHGYVHRFSAGDKSHPRTQEVYAMLDEMVRRLRVAGYVPNTAAFFGNNAASGREEMEEEEREQSLLSHSERLAIAFGLISTKPGASLCIFKNLRICRDCHSVVKLISDIFEREITIRDRNRFHHFKLGSCSCSDYW